MAQAKRAINSISPTAMRARNNLGIGAKRGNGLFLPMERRDRSSQGFCDVSEFSSRVMTSCSGAAWHTALVCSQRRLIDSSASRISLDGAAVSAGAL
jgi:hypothetical protein